MDEMREAFIAHYAARYPLRAIQVQNGCFFGESLEHYLTWQAALASKPVLSEDEAVEIMKTDEMRRTIKMAATGACGVNDVMRLAYRAIAPYMVNPMEVQRDSGYILAEVGFTDERNGERHTFKSLDELITAFLMLKPQPPQEAKDE